MMSKVCIRRTQGGKGNIGMFTERDPNIIAAGKPSVQRSETVAGHLQHYLLQDEVDALVRDSIIPPPKEPKSAQRPPDLRNAGVFTETRALINPPLKTKFQTVIEDFKNTTYQSYWKKPIGQTRDQVPMLPKGFNVYTTTMGKKTEHSESLYDLVMPKDPVPDNSFPEKRLGYQTDRNYCRPPYDPKACFGISCVADNRGAYAKCCLTEKRFTKGSARYSQICSSDADFKYIRNAQLGVGKAPNDNISCVPPGYTFGILEPPHKFTECLSPCDLNSGREFFLKCVSHLNLLRKCLSKRFDGNFFKFFYLQLKYLDKAKTGWLPKQVVYDFCLAKFIRFNPRLIEPLLETWNAFDGALIEYKIFVYVINYKEPSPELPKIPDILPECMEFSTTYKDMVSPGQKVDNRLMAGVPSGRHFDKDYPVTPNGLCKAHRVCLSEESDARSCLNPSVLTVLGINHRDMYAKRSPEEVKRVFGVLGVDLNDEKFNIIWEEAKKSHSQGWVSFETFKTAFFKIYDEESLNNDK